MNRISEVSFRAVSLTTASRFAEASELYRAVFGYLDPAYGLNPRLLGALASNGGSVVGILDESDKLVAFAYGFCGTDRRGFYHYSQSAVVAADQQGHGLGRMLKHAQREVALSHGMSRMRWTYDPRQVRNAHFNLDVLGARGRWFAPDMYGPGTDRVIVEWDLTREQPAVPASMTELVMPTDPAELRSSFEGLLAQGLVAVSCRRLPDGTGAYYFGPADA
ncbi:GNAT family N-acetyltransferase [Kribbella jiaozuonensis]|uniref:GNAT family N-acetyltransferase n=1 Tax=Kribbella jiaozuonensis TaxID=2575441 RepID=A0A4U3LCQ3_9ACTN|nr:GNAT family N-acetyltransferase [Kribbella jiaozuonensis]TKK73218.1 GNAT family N-acetyltransferase [Kribbella jiaozuonensis]